MSEIRIVGLAEMPGPFDSIVQFAGYDESERLVRVMVDQRAAESIRDALVDEGITNVYAEGWQMSWLPEDWPVLLPVGAA